MSISTRASNWVFILNLQYSLSPGFATNLCANSLWNINTAHLNKGRWRSSLNIRGELIWYGTFATHTSKNGSSALSTSPTRICNFVWNGVPCTRFCNSATSLVSISQATTFFTFSSIFTVMLPVPGPISRTTSVFRSADLSIMLVITRGFFRICCPKSLLKTIPERCYPRQLNIDPRLIVSLY